MVKNLRVRYLIVTQISFDIEIITKMAALGEKKLLNSFHRDFPATHPLPVGPSHSCGCSDPGAQLP